MGSPIAAFGGGYVMVVGCEFKDRVQCLCNQSHTCTSTVSFLSGKLLIRMVFWGALRDVEIAVCNGFCVAFHLHLKYFHSHHLIRFTFLSLSLPPLLSPPLTPPPPNRPLLSSSPPLLPLSSSIPRRWRSLCLWRARRVVRQESRSLGSLQWRLTPPWPSCRPRWPLPPPSSPRRPLAPPHQLSYQAHSNKSSRYGIWYDNIDIVDMWIWS